MIQVSGRAAETAAPRLVAGAPVLIVGRVAPVQDATTDGTVNVIADRIDSPALYRAADIPADPAAEAA